MRFRKRHMPSVHPGSIGPVAISGPVIAGWGGRYPDQGSSGDKGPEGPALDAWPGAELNCVLRTPSQEALPYLRASRTDSARVRPCGVLDRIGMGLSMTCAIHCLLTPALAATAALGVFTSVADEGSESFLLGTALVTAVVSLTLGWREHGRLGAFGCVAVAVALIGVGRCLATAAETPLVVAGGMSIALAHFVNAKLCRRCIACRSTTGDDRPAERQRRLVRG
jgi:hypothetical protein